jgi:UDP-N-acetylmuramoyl-L-alanyl-D-glutamate--2,6-diaminopimelate ligase
MRASELIKSIDGFLTLSDLKDFEVKGISCNSKEVLDDFIFVAIKGNREDGNTFINEAIERGARVVVTQSALFSRRAGKLNPPNLKNVFIVAVKDSRRALSRLAAQFYGNPALKLKVVGVTGTNGKTTITYLLEALLKEAGFSPSVIGTINYRFNKKTIPSRNTTPGPVELESMLEQMVKGNIIYAITEVSSHALDQDRAYGIDFHSAIFTNLTQDHLDYHKTLENYFKTKAKLFTSMSPEAFVIINNDDRFGRRLKKLTKARIITYGIRNNAQVSAKDLKFSCLHTEFRAVTTEEEINIKSKLIGRHNVYNILSAIAWGLGEGIDISIIKSAMEKFSLVPGRLERIDFKGDFSIFLDYAHTEDALKNILKTLRQISKKRIIVIFGCGGERDKTKRPKMGKAVSELSDYAIITNDNPRSEDPQKIINDIKKGINKNNYCVISDRFEAIKKAISLAKPEDVVLIAGKGHEEYQILKDRREHFSDKEAVRECLKSLNY